MWRNFRVSEVEGDWAAILVEETKLFTDKRFNRKSMKTTLWNLWNPKRDAKCKKLSDNLLIFACNDRYDMLLSEVAFDFLRGEMTQQKIKDLKQSLNGEFQLIHDFCLRVLSTSQGTELIRATLPTLLALLSWIPLDYIFETPLLSMIETPKISSL
ncbi:hypothetical protein CMV_010533 [Castanea mollissima]|uniref:Exportin-1/Importin-beta-like domain-containing protein n=1 Tax=Castanea mollissima TaxID=60419 RepID=A0A8J4VPK0_9ROSI|nr:hypothetical protein CMV_010533 [Castanea mollissima]